MNDMPNWKRWAARICACLATQASAADPSTAPVLQLDPGTHWAPARRVALSADQRLVATASDDKTVRIWQRDGGRLLQVLRPPIGSGAAGRASWSMFLPDSRLEGPGGRHRKARIPSTKLVASTPSPAVRCIPTVPPSLRSKFTPM